MKDTVQRYLTSSDNPDCKWDKKYFHSLLRRHHAVLKAKPHTNKRLDDVRSEFLFVQGTRAGE